MLYNYHLISFPLPFLQPMVGNSGKRICCACPDTKRVRDECVVMYGEDKCAEVIEAHKACLRAEGFTIK